MGQPGVLVLGGAGFIGSALVPRLEESGFSVKCLSRSSLVDKSQTYESFVEKVGALQEIFNRSEATVIINLAWDKLPDYGVHATSSNAILNASVQTAWADSNIEYFVGLGSCLEYGSARGAIDENTDAVDPSFFGKTKSWLFDQLCGLALESQKPHLWIRPFWLFGPGQRGSSLVPSTIRSVLEGTELILKNPETGLDFLHVDDFSHAAVAMINAKTCGAVNVGSGRATRVGDVASFVRAVLTNQNRVGLSNLEEDSHAAWSSNRALSETTSWIPTSLLEESLENEIHNFLRAGS